MIKSQSATNNRYSRFFTLTTLFALSLLVAGGSPRATADKPISADVGDTHISHPLALVGEVTNEQVLRVRLDKSELARMSTEAQPLISFPLNSRESVLLRLQPFDIIGPATRFVVATAAGETEVPAPVVHLYRGNIDGQANSYAYFGFTEDGSASGYITLENGTTYILSRGSVGELSISRSESGFSVSLPEGVEFCGTTSDPVAGGSSAPSSVQAPLDFRGVKLAHVAIEGDQEYVALFGGDISATNAYVVQLFGAISSVYERDVDTRFQITTVRLWPTGGAPFSSDNLSSLRDHWLANENLTGQNYVHLLSGRRDLPFGGIGYIASGCIFSSYAISGYLNGAFASPLEENSLNNWDVTVIAHEMGHNSGSGHTHSIGWYNPVIDDCGNGIPNNFRGTILSYCHIHTGYLTNLDVRFHARVQVVLQDAMGFGGCLDYDCNGNGIDDDIDISVNMTSADVNSDFVPDECQDCNNNGILDDEDIFVHGMADIDGNEVPDVCQADCNSDGLPDVFSPGTDQNGNNVPDECEPDCNLNTIPDFLEIALGSIDDFDRDNVPDECQDCDANTIPDWLDMERQHNLFVADLSGDVREYHERSGWPIQQLQSGGVFQPYDLTFGPDNMLYVANFGDGSNGEILKMNPDLGTSTVFVASGGPLAGPSGVVFGADNNLYVADLTTSSVRKFDGATGADLGAFVPSGSGGLSSPYALVFGPNGNLFVTTSWGGVLEYSSADGSFVGHFVVAACCVVAGDANGNGAMNIADAVFIINRIFANGSEPPCIDAGDANGNNSFNIGDAVHLITHVFSSGPPPACGTTVVPDNGGLTDPRGLVFLASGNLVVTSFGDNRMLEYDGTTGDFLKEFNDLADVDQPWGIKLGPNGNVFVARGGGVPRILEYVPEGRYHRYYVRNEANMQSPTGLVFRPQSQFDGNGNGILDICE